VVWTSELIKKVKRVDSAISWVVDHWFDSTIGGYITEFTVDRVESYNQAERYFFKGPRGKFLHFLKLRIKVIKIWTRGQNLAQKSKFSELPQNEHERSPRRHEPNATHLGSNGHREREISRSVRIVKQVKKIVTDCTVRTG
jgi:hypothetical protein